MKRHATTTISADTAPRSLKSGRNAQLSTPRLRRSVIMVRQALRGSAVGLAALQLFAFTPPALALPTGEGGTAITDGLVTVNRDATNTTMQITQTPSKAIVTWTGFSIDTPEAVNINQLAGPSAILLNRVTGTDPSQIFGTLTANGRVFLINPNGVLFGQDAQVNVGGLVASTRDIADSAFEADNFTFTGSGLGTVENRGTITITQPDSYAALIGKEVINTGTINAIRATVAMAAGNQVTLNMAGDSLIGVTVTQPALQAAILNTGNIIADGGSVLLTARGAEGLLGTVINNEGIIRATSLVERNGSIVLDAGSTGLVSNSGTLDVAGATAGTVAVGAGTVNLSGDIVSPSITGTATTVNIQSDVAEIQDGVDLAASGAQVNVAAGTYEESVTINKTLSLRGAQDGVNPSARTDSNVESIVAPVSGESAITLTGGANNVAISGFTLDGSGAGRMGVEETAPLTGTVVRENIIKGFTSLGVAFGAGSSGGQVVNNDISGVYAGVYLSTGASGVQVSGNRVHGLTGTSLDQGAAIVFEGNNRNVTVSQNVLENNAHGLYVWDIYGTDFSSTTVTNNSVAGAGNGVTNTNATTIDASGNWWGTTDQAAIAAKMTGPVDFTPYLASGIDTNAAAGFQGDFSTLFVTGLGEQVQSGGRINEAIGPMASTVNVNAGTYNEDVLLDVAGLTLQSVSGAATTTISGVNTGFTGAVRIAANGVTLGGEGKGFTIVGAGQAGVYVNGGLSGLTVRDNVITAADGKNALLSEGGQSDHTIQGNTFNGAASQLVYVNGAPSVGNASTNVNFVDNTFSGSATGPLLGQEADNSLVSGNTFTGETDFAALEVHGDNVTVSGNTLTAGGTGAGIVVSQFAAGTSIDRNTIRNFETGIDIAGSASVSRNTINTNAIGVRVSGGLVSAQENFITGNETGILVTDTAGAVGPIFNNDLSGNTTAAVDNASTGLVVDASGNWWGATTGSDIAAMVSGAGLVDFTPFLVRGTDTNSGTNGFQGDFSTVTVTTVGGQSGGGRVQEGVNLVDVGGGSGTVNVEAGTYVEDVTIAKNNLQLRSLNGALATTIEGVNTGFTGAVRIAADNVTLGGEDKGFTIVGTGQAGVYVSGARSGLTVQDNIITAANGKNALLTDGGQSNHTIEGNTFDGAASQLVYVNGAPSVGNASTNVDFIDNAFSGSATGPLLGTEADNSEIAGNTFNGLTGYAGLEVHGDNAMVSGNTFTGSGGGAGILVSGFASGTTIDGANTIRNFATGIHIAGTASVLRNAITGNSTGISVTDGGRLVSAQENFITGNTTGVLVTATAASVGPILNNDLSGSTFAVHNANPGLVVDASRNWWGTTVQNDIDAMTPGAVDFTPYLASGTDTAPAAAGFQGDFSTLFVSSLGEQVQAGGRINEAIGLVTGSTVNVNDGTYTEDVLIDVAGLTLQSMNGSNFTTIQGVNTGFTGAVRIAANGVTLGGDGKGFTIAGAGQAGVYVNGGLSDLTVQGNLVIAANGKNALLTEGGQSNHTIQGNRFSGAASQLVYVIGDASVSNASTNVDFIDNVFSGSATGPLLGQEAAGSEITGNTFSGTSPFAALELWGADNTVTDNTFDGSGVGSGILVNAPATGTTVGENIIRGFDIGAQALASDLSITGNSFTGNGVDVVLGSTTFAGTLANVDVSGNGQTSVEIQGSATLDDVSIVTAAGAVTVRNDITLAAGGLTIDTADGAGAGAEIDFLGAIHGASEAGALELTAGADDITFVRAVGEANALGSITINSARNVNFVSTVETVGALTQLAGTGTTTFQDLATVGTDASITTGAIDFTGAGSINANSGTGTVTLTAQAGAITGGGAPVDITAASAKLSAVSGIFVSTAVANVKATNSNNGIEINNTGDLTLTNFGSGNAITNTNGGLNLFNEGTITVDSPIVVGKRFGLIAAGGGDINVNADITGNAVSTFIGLSGLLAAEGDIHQAAGTAITVDSTGGVFDPLLITAGIDGAGAFVQEAGASIAYAGGDVTVVTNGAATMAGSITSGDLAVISNGGPILLPSGSVTGDLSAESSGGDITQTGALGVAGTSDINAGAGAITLTNTANDFGGTVTLTGTVTKVTDANELTVVLDTGETVVIANASLSSTGDLTIGGKTGDLIAISNGGVLQWLREGTLPTESDLSATSAILIAGTPSETITGPGSEGNVLSPLVEYTNLANATGGSIAVEGELVLIAGNLPRHPNSQDEPSITAGSAILDIDSLTPGNKVTIVLNGQLRLLADKGVFRFKAGSELPKGVTTLDPKVVQVFIGNVSITSTLDELAQRAAIAAAQQSALNSASADARQSFGTDSVTQQIDMGFSGDVGIAPTMGHSVPLEGEIISTPPCVTESRAGEECK